MTVSWDIRPYWLPILVCAGGFVLVAMKHELFGMGQDEGVYQTVAINFLNGVTDRQQDFPEYHTLSGHSRRPSATACIPIWWAMTSAAGHTRIRCMT